MVEQRDMKANKKKSKESLEALKKELIDLRKQDRESHVKLVEERREAERKRNMLTAHLICLKDELVNFGFSIVYSRIIEHPRHSFRIGDHAHV